MGRPGLYLERLKRERNCVTIALICIDLVTGLSWSLPCYSYTLRTVQQHRCGQSCRLVQCVNADRKMSLTISKGLCNVSVGKCNVCFFCTAGFCTELRTLETRNDYALSMKLTAIIVYWSWLENNTRADVFVRCAKEKKIALSCVGTTFIWNHVSKAFPAKSCVRQEVGRLTHTLKCGPSPSRCLHSSSGEFQEWRTHPPLPPPPSFCNVKRYQTWTNIVNSSSS